MTDLSRNKIWVVKSHSLALNRLLLASQLKIAPKSLFTQLPCLIFIVILNAKEMCFVINHLPQQSVRYMCKWTCSVHCNGVMCLGECHASDGSSIRAACVYESPQLVAYFILIFLSKLTLILHFKLTHLLLRISRHFVHSFIMAMTTLYCNCQFTCLSLRCELLKGGNLTQSIIVSSVLGTQQINESPKEMLWIS